MMMTNASGCGYVRKGESANSSELNDTIPYVNEHQKATYSKWWLKNRQKHSLRVAYATLAQTMVKEVNLHFHIIMSCVPFFLHESRYEKISMGKKSHLYNGV